MAKLPIDENTASRERLAATVAALTEADLSTTLAGDITVAQLLAQIAFWDRWAEQLLIRWRSGEMPPPSVPDWYDDAIDRALADQWRALRPDVAGRLAVDAARSVDREIFRVESPVEAALTASGQSHLLHRHVDRDAALDRIDRAVHRSAA
jgi:hypothetical protein